MTTLGGDLIRMLAHGGISTLGNIGAQYVGDYFKQKSLQEMLGLKTGLEAAGVESDPVKQQQILQQLRGPLKLPVVTESGMVPVGEEPTVANLGVRKNLTYPEDKYTPATLERVVTPVPSIENLKAKTAMEMTPTERKLGFYPRDASLQAARENLLATLAFKEQEGALNRISREDIAKDRLTMQQMIASVQQAGQEQARQQTQQWRDFLKQNYTDKLGLLKDANERRQVEGDLGKLTALEGKILGAKKLEEKRMFMSQANELIKNSKVLQGYPMWEEDVTIPGTGIMGSDWFGTKQKVPVGQKPSEAPKAATPTPQQYLLPKGGTMVPVTKEQYDAYILKYGVPR